MNGAIVFGAIGGLLASVALFLAAEPLIPSVAGRLALLASAFLAIAFLFALKLRRTVKAVAARRAPDDPTVLTSIQPVDHVGE